MIYLLAHNRTVLRPEADTVAERNPHACFARFVGDVIEITIRVRLIEVDRRWDLVCMHRAERRSQTRGAARTLRMTDLRLRCRHRNPCRLPVKRELQRARFNSIVEQSGRAVEVYVVKIFRLAASVCEREAHGTCRLVTIFSESHAMIRIARRAIAGHFSVNLSAAIECMA